MAIVEGDPLPNITLLGADGAPFNVCEPLGKALVLYFYPKDDTAGCTREAQDFSARLDAFTGIGVAVLGVSKDSPAKHRKFTAKYDLSVPLASDEDGVLMEAMGVWVEKSMYGKSYMGIERSTFLFDAAGKLRRAWRKVRVPGHVDEVLEAARLLA